MSAQSSFSLNRTKNGQFTRNSTRVFQKSDRMGTPHQEDSQTENSHAFKDFKDQFLTNASELLRYAQNTFPNMTLQSSDVCKFVYLSTLETNIELPRNFTHFFLHKLHFLSPSALNRNDLNAVVLCYAVNFNAAFNQPCYDSMRRLETLWVYLKTV